MIRQHHLIRGTIALLAAALTASLAPAAWADPAPLAKAEATIAANSESSTAVRPNPDEQTASNVPAITGASCGDVCSGDGYGPVSVTTRAPATTAPCGDVCSGHGYGPVNVSTRAIPNVRPPAAAPSSGFDWADAGIGAGSMLALTLIGVGGVLAASNRRGRHTHQRQASASR
ncbi:MAG: hypothetical protein M3065_09345 [Actinomycetota bacterium]|nr:hypothetical protein [Actinomycetota bacterium]